MKSKSLKLLLKASRFNQATRMENFLQTHFEIKSEATKDGENVNRNLTCLRMNCETGKRALN